MTRSAWIAGIAVATLAGSWFIHTQREAAKLAEADRARAEEIRAEALGYREGDSEERTAQLNARVDAAIKQLKSDSPTVRCNAALQLGRIGTGAQINVLTDVVFDYSELTSVRICAARALRQMGETSTVLGIYESWAQIRITICDERLFRASVRSGLRRPRRRCRIWNESLAPSSGTFATLWSSRLENLVRLRTPCWRKRRKTKMRTCAVAPTHC